MKNGEKLPILLSIEDEEGFDGGLPDAIVPVVFTRGRKKIEGECYFGAYPALRSFLAEYGENPFTRGALEALDRALAPYLASIGYERGGGVYRFYRSFVLWNKEKLNAGPILPSSVILDGRTLRRVKVNRTDFDLRELRAKRLQTVFTLDEHGEVLSVASVNEHSAGQRLLEMSVYTLPQDRGRGYAASNGALLAKTLLEERFGVIYVCSCRNAPSIAVAKKIGLTEENRFYAVDAYKTNGT